MAIACKVSELPPGGMIMVKVDNDLVAVANVDGQYYAFSDVCTHQGCSLAEGYISGMQVFCECHGGAFDVTSGVAVSGPVEEPVKTYPVSVQGDDVVVG